MLLLLLTTMLHCHPKGNKDSQHSDTNDDSLGLAEDVVEDVVVTAQRGQAERWILGSCRFPVSLLFHPLAPPPPNAQGVAPHPSGLQYFLQIEALHFYKNQGETWPQIPPSSPFPLPASHLWSLLYQQEGKGKSSLPACITVGLEAQ